MQKKIYPYLLVLPCIICLAVIVLYPFASAVYVSFTKTSFFKPQKFIGLDNYIHLLFENPEWKQVVSNTIVWTFFSVALSYFFALGVALLLNQGIKGQNIIRALFLLPWAIPPVVGAMIFLTFYFHEGGVFNYILRKLLITDTNIGWLSNPRIVLLSLIGVVFWKFSPFLIVGLSAARQVIPDRLYDAAEIDGASSWQQFMYITMPNLLPISLVLVVVQLIWRINHFDVIWTLTRGGPGISSQITSTYAYRYSFDFLRLGYGAAIGVVTMFFILVFVVYYVRQIQN